MTLLPLGSVDSGLEQYIPDVLPWIHEAGNPYFDWIFGGPEAARQNLARWMRRLSSEVAIGRVNLLFERNRPVGGFIALRGTDLAVCRRADALDLLREAAEQGDAEFPARLKAVRNLFPRVAADEFYLSKMGVAAELRGIGCGRRLALEYLRAGRVAGCRRFRLDIWTGNKRARGLYESLGFEVASESLSEEAGMRYLSMVKRDME